MASSDHHMAYVPLAAHDLIYRLHPVAWPDRAMRRGAGQRVAVTVPSQTRCNMQAAAARESDGADSAEAAALSGHPAQR